MHLHNVRMHFRTACLSATFLTVFSALPVHSAPEKRVVRIPYEGFRGIAIEGTTVYPTLPNSPSMTIEAQPEERHLRVRVVDDFSENVRAIVWLDTNRDWTPEETYDICGRSKRIPVEPGARIGVDLFAGSCRDRTPSVVTEGTVIATLTT